MRIAALLVSLVSVSASFAFAACSSAGDRDDAYRTSNALATTEVSCIASHCPDGVRVFCEPTTNDAGSLPDCDPLAEACSQNCDIAMSNAACASLGLTGDASTTIDPSAPPSPVDGTPIQGGVATACLLAHEIGHVGDCSARPDSGQRQGCGDVMAEQDQRACLGRYIAQFCSGSGPTGGATAGDCESLCEQFAGIATDAIYVACMCNWVAASPGQCATPAQNDECVNVECTASRLAALMPAVCNATFHQWTGDAGAPPATPQQSPTSPQIPAMPAACSDAANGVHGFPKWACTAVATPVPSANAL